MVYSFASRRRLLVKRFLLETKPEIPVILASAAAGDVITEEVFNSCSSVYEKFEEFTSNIRKGALGKTAKFWVMYLDIMKMQHMSHTAVQENDLDLRIKSWERFLPLYFVFNMSNYARYGSFYLETLRSMDELYPGMKTLFSKTGLSIQGQDRYPLRTAVDQRGEQTINRSAKPVAALRFFSTNQPSVLKWCLNRADAAANSQALNDMAGLGEGSSVYKPLRPSQILLSEELVGKVATILEEEYINPFHVNIDKTKLVNLSSGVPVPDDTADAILNSYEDGINLSQLFRKDRLLAKNTNFHHPIKRNNYASFSTKSVTISKSNKTKTVEVNRNIIGNLLKFSAKREKVIDFEKALKYPLCRVPLSISHPDGSRRESAKSKLKQIILGYLEEQQTNETVRKDVVIIDMIAQVQTIIRAKVTTYESFAERFVKSLPTGYEQIELIADTYRETSIKSMERKKRGESKKNLIHSLKSKMPADLSRLLRNGENKTRLMELILSYIEQSKKKVFNLLRCNKIVISLENKCVIITRSEPPSDDASLASIQEEADTKLILHSYHILSQSPERQATIRSPSGDTDVLVLAVALLYNFRDRVIVDDGCGEHRKQIRLKDLDLEDDIIDGLIGFHAYTGNDYVSSCFRRGKLKCFQLFERSTKFKRAFTNLGEDWQLSDDLVSVLEEFTCHLYGSRSKDINKLRYKMFNNKYMKENKIIDMCILPPCRSVLNLHLQRANFVAALWKRSKEANIEIPPIETSGWYNDGSIMWIETSFPDDIEEMFLDDEYDDSDGEYGDEGESESES